MNRKKSIAVVGAGFAGLSAATFLAQEGHDVVVFEKNREFGGRARAFDAEGFRFDMGPSWYWMPDVFQRYFSQLGENIDQHLQLMRLDPAFSIYFGLESYYNIPDRPVELYALFEKIEKGAGDRLKRFLHRAGRLYELVMQKTIYKPSISPLEYIDRKLMQQALTANFFKSFAKSIREEFSDPRLLRILEFPTLFLGGKPKDIPTLYSIMNYAGHVLGTWYPKGGLHSIIQAMVRVAQKKNLRLVDSAPIRSIFHPADKPQQSVLRQEY